MSIKIKTISTVQLPPPKCRKNLFHVVLTRCVDKIDASLKTPVTMRFLGFFCAKNQV